jgi:antitoxin Phd
VNEEMEMTWEIQDAKKQFSKIVESALKQGPQYVTKRGVREVVVVSIKEYEVLKAQKQNFKDFLLSCPKLDISLDLDRNQDNPRSLDL